MRGKCSMVFVEVFGKKLCSPNEKETNITLSTPKNLTENITADVIVEFCKRRWTKVIAEYISQKDLSIKAKRMDI